MIVLDTHIWLMWIIHGEADLSPEIAAALQKESRIGVSAISSFEVAHLLKRRRIELPLPLNDWLREALEPSGIDSLPVTSEIAANSVNLVKHHKDPADRIIIATAITYDAKLASLDATFRLYTELGNRLISA
ncbi:MAG: type II toxin-antitoxin system VapC family toxin [Gammaproteobacteria bacterium]